MFNCPSIICEDTRIPTLMVLLKVIRITIITVRLTLSGHDGDFEHRKKMCIDRGPEDHKGGNASVFAYNTWAVKHLCRILVMRHN